MKKVGIISQARMTSTRLPGKVLLLVKNVSLLKYHTDRLRQSGYPVFLATTVNPTDDVIAEFAITENLGWYRGDENHVLSRFYETAKNHGLEVIVRVTSDCPLVDGELIKQGVEEYLKINSESVYLSNTVIRSYPRGLDFEIFSFRLLAEAAKKAQGSFQQEHVTPYIKEQATLEHIVYPEDASNFRITVDTPEDFELIQILIENFAADQLGSKDLIRLLRNHPELTQINAHIEQKKI
ncbi:cytidylyltransferase domain-containing protein [Adhaeribacter pallidiroseus]|uniref:3-deoxy-manno-octulosonate cytidylyltransferase n=1 Tax=Adhaeribacter pallidiroseus TaxID=2072847 RepID=A0A369QC44_9BACT|nr:glycosyltransferase family protein [Adhaeribacter pallidiroseus]RDC62012.1 hypothetical protein AHMF7616_00602 [Adhaeribacter pallidiroseus]